MITQKSKNNNVIFLSPIIFIGMGIVDIILYYYLTNYYLVIHSPFPLDPFLNHGLLPLVLLFESISFICYSIFLKIGKVSNKKKPSFFELLLVIMFLFGAVYFILFVLDYVPKVQPASSVRSINSHVVLPNM